MKRVLWVGCALVFGLAARAMAPLAGDPVDCVNPLSGCNGDAEFSRGNTVAAIVAPFGMTTWAPQTDGDGNPFYQMKHSRFEGIRATHQPSIWIRDYGDFLIQPVVGAVEGKPKERASVFSHDREIARPYLYSVELERYDTRLELTPSERCAFFRFGFPDTREAAVIFRLEGELEEEASSGKHRIRGKATHVTFGAPGGFGKYFVAEFDQPHSGVEVEREGKIVTATVRFAEAKRARPVAMRIGTSFIHHKQAALNLGREMPDWDFAAATARSRAAWARELGRVEIRGETPAQRTTFYTALYRSLQFPRMFHEPDSEGRLRH